MASKTVKTGNYGCSIRIEYNFGVSGRSWWLDARMIFNTGQYNMGPWGSYGSTYLHTTTGNGGLPSTGAGTDYIIINWTRITSGTYDNAGTAPTVSFGWSWGVNSSWANMSYPSGTVSVTGSAAPNITPPTNVSINPVPSRTTINLNRSWQNATACQYNINDWGWINENASYNNGVKVSGNTVSNLTPNTSYKCQIRMNRNGGSYTASSAKTVITTHNAPTIGNVSLAYTRAADVPKSTYKVDFSYDVSYDYTSFASRTIEYGTSTSYGASVSDKSISGLKPNTTYYYKITENDNGGNSTTSSSVTGQFTTGGIAPTISNLKIDAGRIATEFSFNINYDTNAKAGSYRIDYGTTTSYGSSVSNTKVLSDLSVNTTYYYKITVTDNYNRSNSYTGEFTTTANPPSFTSETIEDVGTDYAILSFVAVADLNVNIVKYSLYNQDGDKLEQENTTGRFEIVDLLSEAVYGYYCIITDSLGLTNRSLTLTFETLASKFVHYIESYGNGYLPAGNLYPKNDIYPINIDKLIRLVGIGDLKNFIRHIELSVGGIDFEVGRNYALACNQSTSTTTMRSNLISIQDTTLNTGNACFITSSKFSWKIQHYDSNGNGLSQIKGQAGESCVINFLDADGYIAIEIGSTNKDEIIASTKMYGCNDGDLNSILNNTKKLVKTVTPTDLVKVSRYMRYIDVGASGSNVDADQHICEIEVYDTSGINRARGITATLYKGDSLVNPKNATDGNNSTYLTATGINTIIRFDLGAVYEISHIKLYRYYADGRKYKKTFVYGRAGDRLEDDLHDGELCYKFHDYKRDGIYTETSSGKVWYVDNAPIDTSVPVINSFSASNTTTWTNQGVVLTILASDNFGTDNLIYSFDGGKNWTGRNQIIVFKNQTYTAVVKDKQGNVSKTNPTIEVNNIDIKAPSSPVVIMKYDNIAGKEYKGEWTNKDIYVDVKVGLSPNRCSNIVERGYIDKQTGEDIVDDTHIREVNYMTIKNPDTLYIWKGNYLSDNIDDGIITLYFYNQNHEYLYHSDIDLNNPFIKITSEVAYCRLADTSDDVNNYYMVAESDVEIPYIEYYNVYDDLSGIKGWYYTKELDGNTYLPLPTNERLTKSTVEDMYIVTRDNAGNNSPSIKKIVRIDKEPPRDVKFSYTKTSNSITISAQAIDDLSGLRGFLYSGDNGNTWVSSSKYLPLPMDNLYPIDDFYPSEINENDFTFSGLDGIYDIVVRAIDNAGNYKDSEPQIVVVGDTSKYPFVSSVDGNATSWTNKNVTLTINGQIGSNADTGATISRYSFDNGKTWVTDNKKVFSENQTVYVRVEDNNGRKSETYIVEITKIDKMPPTLNIPSTILNIAYETTIDLWKDISYYDNDSGIDENKKKTVPANSRDLALGEQTIEYTVVDKAGNVSTKIRNVKVLGSVPANTLYPRDTLYPNLVEQ